jgi:4-hydroxybenzoate polyprenyltransferase
VLTGYALLTLAYSFALKRLMAFDVIALFIRYSHRGTSPWIAWNDGLARH